VATDVDWQKGDGERVEGPMAAVLLLLTGRTAGVPELSGPGTTLLASRLTPASAPSAS
jgi:hypothetical protein